MRPVARALLAVFQYVRRTVDTIKSTGLPHRRLSASALLVAIALLSELAPARSQDFETSKIFVCSNMIKSRTDVCREVVPPFDNLDRRSFPSKRVDFKFTILGRGEALGHLQSKNYLPATIAVWRDRIRIKKNDIPLGINQSEWDANADELNAQFAEDGQFRWRTFFHINLHDVKKISIEINNAQGRTVPGDGGPARLSLGFIN